MTSPRSWPNQRLQRDTTRKHYLLPSGDHFNAPISVYLLVNLHLVEIVEENIALSLTAKDIDLLVDSTARVRVSGSWDVADLLTTVPSQINLAVNIHRLLRTPRSSPCIFVHHLEKKRLRFQLLLLLLQVHLRLVAVNLRR